MVLTGRPQAAERRLDLAQTMDLSTTSCSVLFVYGRHEGILQTYHEMEIGADADP